MSRTPSSPGSEILREMEEESLKRFSLVASGLVSLGSSSKHGRRRVGRPLPANRPGDFRFAWPMVDDASSLPAGGNGCLSPVHPCRSIGASFWSSLRNQAGPKACVLNLAGHTIDLNPRSMLVVFPNLDLTAAVSRRAASGISTPWEWHSYLLAVDESRRPSSKEASERSLKVPPARMQASLASITTIGTGLEDRPTALFAPHRCSDRGLHCSFDFPADGSRPVGTPFILMVMDGFIIMAPGVAGFVDRAPIMLAA